MLVDYEDFQKIRKELKSLKDLNRFPYSRGALFTILSQKRVDMVKKRHPMAIRKLDEIASYWNRRKSVPPWLNLTPMMSIRILLRAIGFTKAEIRNSLNNPQKVDDEKLEQVIWNALFTDYVYSPLAVTHQFARGRLGENIIKYWLERENIEFKDEYELRNESSKTPDFYFPEPIRLGDREIVWIESKALFGDPRTHKVYSKKQYHRYQELFGDGYVVYWFGQVKGLDNNVRFLSNNFFSSRLKDALLDMRFYDSAASFFKDGSFRRMVDKFPINCFVNLGAEVPFECVEIPELMDREEDFSEYMRTKDFLEGMSKLIDLYYTHGEVMLICEEKDWRKCHRRHISWALKNLGFDVVHLKHFG
ncbi:MAG: TPD domain-containing protein [Archaeoglobaceae archaeon]